MKVKVIWLYLAIVMAFLQNGHTQEKKKGVHKLWVELMDSEEVVVGKLLELGDSAITLRIWESERVEKFKVTEVKKMKFRRKGAVGKGIAIGAGAGLLAGVIIGQADGDDPPGFLSFTAEEKSVVNGVGLIFVGAPVGGIIGSWRKKFNIDGQQAVYDQMKPELSRYVPLSHLNEK